MSDYSVPGFSTRHSGNTVCPAGNGPICGVTMSKKTLYASPLMCNPSGKSCSKAPRLPVGYPKGGPLASKSVVKETALSKMAFWRSISTTPGISAATFRAVSEKEALTAACRTACACPAARSSSVIRISSIGGGVTSRILGLWAFI